MYVKVVVAGLEMVKAIPKNVMTAMSIEEAIGVLDVLDPSAATDAQTEFDELNNQIDSLTEEVTNLVKEKDELQDEIDEIKQKITNLYNEI